MVFLSGSLVRYFPPEKKFVMQYFYLNYEDEIRLLILNHHRINLLQNNLTYAFTSDVQRSHPGLPYEPHYSFLPHVQSKLIFHLRFEIFWADRDLSQVYQLENSTIPNSGFHGSDCSCTLQPLINSPLWQPPINERQRIHK